MSTVIVVGSTFHRLSTKENPLSHPESLISFEELNHLLVPLGALNSPAELHGMLCGKLSGGVRLSAEEWLVQALEFLDIITDENQGVVGDHDGAGQRALARLYPVVLAQLEDEHFSFQLLLPTDDASLEIRSEALGQWCHGFLSGFGSSGIAGDQKFSSEAADAMRDLAAIVSIVHDGDDGEEEESNFFDIAEYVRMAVLTLFTELGGDSSVSSPSEKRPLH